MQKKEFISTSDKETQKIATEILNKYSDRNVFCLIGDLGSGKTTFVKGIAKELGIKQHVTSPTFVLINRYTSMVHVDLYRLKKVDEDTMRELHELYEKSELPVFIEWADRLDDNDFPNNAVIIFFEYINEKKRKIVVKEKKQKILRNRAKK